MVLDPPRTVVLLGAGASREAGVPTTAELTSKMFERLNAGSNAHRVLSYVVGGLLFELGIKDLNPLGQTINVEDVFNAVRRLGARKELEVAAFVGGWHPIVEELDATHLASNAAAAEAEQNWIAERGYRPKVRPTMSPASDALYQLAARSSTAGVAFEKAQAELLWLLQCFTWISPSEAVRASHLRPLLRWARQTEEVSLFTLNYDNTIELAGGLESVGVSRGLEEWSQEGLVGFEAGSVPLVKLHGSIDWRWGEGSGICRTVESVDAASMDKRSAGEKGLKGRSEPEPAVIFGAGNKLQPEGPFLELLELFRRRLAACPNLVVIGYSFGDRHVNELILRWYGRHREGRRLIVVNGPEFDERETTDFGSLEIENTENMASEFIQLLG